MEKHDSPVSRRWICAVLAALTLLVFGQVRHFDFINFDDPFIVSANPHIQDGLTLQGIRWAFSADFFSDSLHADYWQPVTFLSRMLDIGIFGMNAGMFHLVNLCFHLLNTLLLFHLLQRMTTLGGWPPPRGGEQATLGGWRAGAVERSAWVAALFAVHPLRVEAVAWVVERKELLCGFFWILTMLAYLRYVERPQWRRYVPVILLFAAALMSKPMAVTLPCVLLLMDWWPLGRGRGEGGWWMVDGGQRTMDPGPWTTDCDQRAMGMKRKTRLILEKMPLFLLSAASCLITMWGLWLYLRPPPAGNAFTSVLTSYLHYFAKMALPVHLAIFYPRTACGLAGWQLFAGGLLLAILSIWTVREIRRRPWFFVGWWWFVGTLAPVANLSDIVMADRFTYLPSIGFFIIIAWGAPSLLETWRWRRAALRTAGALVIGACALMSRVQTGYWQNSITLFEHALRVTSDNHQAHYSLALALADAGRVDESLAHHAAALRLDPTYADDYLGWHNLAVALARAGRAREAMTFYKRALKVKPDYTNARNNLGNLLLAEGKTQEAIAQWNEALRSDPGCAEAHYNLARALNLQGAVSKALGHYAQAVHLQPAFADAHHNLGTLLFEQGRIEEGVRHWLAALRCNPNLPNTHYNLGSFLLSREKTEPAIQHLKEAVRLNPAFAEAHAALANALDAGGRSAEAIAQFQEALRLKPDFAEAHNNLATVLLRQGRMEEAVAHLTSVIQLKPDFFEARCNLGGASLRMGRFEAATEHYGEAVRLKPDWSQGHCLLGAALEKLGRTAEAAAEYRRALQLAPESPGAAMNLAWILATDDHSRAHDPAEALRLAQIACRGLGENHPQALDALAAALAANGRFREARQNALKAADLASAQGQEDAAREIRARAKRYESNLPFRRGTAISGAGDSQKQPRGTR